MPLRTIVVGGGIGGLSLARELARLGLPAVVLERAPKLGTVGAGIIMNPNAMRVLEANGLAAGVRSRSTPYLARDTFDHRGRRLATRDYRPLYADGRLAAGALLHRAHLHECLYDGLPPGTVHLDTRIRGFEADPPDARVRRAFAGLAATENVVCTDIEEVRQESWARDRVALLGDAAHALSPNLGQGAGMAMEDAVVLADELAKADGGEQSLEAALASYVARRRERVETVVRLSRRVGEEGQLSGPLACWLRNRRLRREGRAPERVEAALERLLAWP